LLSRADRVCFVEDERLVAAGPHADLLRTEPGYARLVLRGSEPPPEKKREEAGEERT
jgi:ABC-type multidrug transport system fused ATPase/permease subunit